MAPEPKSANPAGAAAGWRWVILPFALAAVAVAVYSRSLTAYFVSDDLEGIWWATTGADGRGPLSHQNDHVRIVPLATLQATHALFGLRPIAFHLGNLAFHVINACLVAALTVGLSRRLGRGERSPDGVAPVAVLAAFTFLVLPSHTEAVSWISGRNDLLAATGSLLALVLWLRARSWRDRWGIAAVVAFVAALLAKESAVCVPALVAAIEVAAVVRRRPWREAVGEAARAAARALPFVVVLAAYLAWRQLALGVIVPTYDGGALTSGNPLVAGVRLPVMLVRSVLPGMAWTSWLVVGAAAVALAAVVVARRSQLARLVQPSVRLWLAGLGCALLALAPAAGLGVSPTDTGGERLTYLASAFVALIIASAAVSLARQHRVGGGVAIGLALAVAALITNGVDGRWREAGDLSAAVVRDGAAFDEERPVFILDAPDTLRGAYVGRNGISPGTALQRGWDDPTLVTQLLDVRFARVDDVVDLTATGPRTWTLTLPPGARFETVADGGIAWDLPGFAVEQVAERSVVITIEPSIDLTYVWYVSEGQVRPLVG